MYFFARVLSPDKDKNRGLNLANNELSGRVFVRKIIDMFNVHPALTKSTCNRFKGSFVTHKLGDPVSFIVDVTFKLKIILL